MRNKLIIAAAILGAVCLLFSCAAKKTATVSVGSFYNLGIAFVRTDANGKDYFNVHAKGSNDAECKYNAKMELLKALIYEGVSQGITIPPELNMPADVKKFRAVENQFYNNAIGNGELIDAGEKIDNSNRLAQSGLKTAPLTMMVTVGINRSQLEKSLKNYINQN